MAVPLILAAPILCRWPEISTDPAPETLEAAILSLIPAIDVAPAPVTDELARKIQVVVDSHIASSRLNARLSSEPK